ncbi:hypothetical protein QJS04_geneDACA013292 [Acorus gramineus]|uniref:Uncharacterized protein n=1 Tax=Acorus gramineus TaxID=55184 RepID=A0AAV9BE23_ACOGR|nr:hypothetical protein QJS04_geneDACA013292 [Acorus gramineus]
MMTLKEGTLEVVVVVCGLDGGRKSEGVLVWLQHIGGRGGGGGGVQPRWRDEKWRG